MLILTKKKINMYLLKRLHLGGLFAFGFNWKYDNVHIYVHYMVLKLHFNFIIWLFICTIVILIKNVCIHLLELQHLGQYR